jgi:uncharacterized membrane protein
MQQSASCMSTATKPPSEGAETKHAAYLSMMPYALAMLFACIYAILSCSRHLQMKSTGFDLGIFEQAIRAYSQLHAPVSDLKGFSLLGDHFSPILILIAPAYRVFPSPLTLLVAQALLIASAVIPIARHATSRLGVACGTCIGLGFGLSWGLQNAVVFDFHEIAFAVPIVAFSAERLLLRQWKSALLIAALLLLVKEDLALTFAAMGVYIAFRGKRRLGFMVTVAGIVACCLQIFVVIPALLHAGSDPYLRFFASTHKNPVTRLFTPAVKLVTLVRVLIPSGFLAIASPLFLLAVPTLAWRF